ncbi:trypsin-like cysteine/serine peptidase domain-containing protein [Cunninghamella echinulata]|nr:trypsin-like cysteine/serine peptidase domain-containing protein [Cunninghamella echinulata]
MWIHSFYILILFCLSVTAKCLCGRSIGASKFIANGQPVMNPTKYPWMAQISFLENGRKTKTCTGSVISRQWIITSGSCVEDRNMQIVVHVGGVIPQNTPNDGFNVVNVIRHPNYNVGRTLQNDVALLRLDRPILYSAAVQPICLPPTGITMYPGSLTTAGWGILGNDGPPASILQEVQLTENLSCFQRGGDQLTHICAQIRDGRATCYGDIGGPLMYELSGNFNLVGITSGVIEPNKCGTEGAPIYFTRVATYVNWINQYTAGQC